MFNHVGEKIKKVTVVFCIIGIVLSIVGGGVLMYYEQVLAGVLTAILGSLLCWVGSLVTYAIGSIEDNLTVLTDIACKKALAESKKDA